MKWKGGPMEDATWLSKAEVDRLSFPQPFEK